ncbi:restriction endonuclease subunit R [Gluconobacter thailandicus]|uniref:DEAD/DEAH box helicase n=1 Tax=Gluconobacter thailandicus TaxID=257438 RepID=UPI000776EEB9|nr:DEAD/DEAH box helicase [Gluconobacter thailandicus]KXV35718.1 restriction endonuclease subunit R [Gluconobacter thailandicus]
MIALRPYQQKCVTEVGQNFRQGFRAVLLVAPTGAGKTVMFSYMAETYLSRRKRVLIVAHRKELIKQASDKLKAAGIPHGIIAPWAEQVPELVQVGSVQTLRGRLGKLPRFDLIVIDEAHHSVAGDWARLLASQPQAFVCGVTASPERMDGKSLGVNDGGVYETMVLGPTIAELIALGFLTPSKVYAPSIPDMIGIRTKKGDFDTTQLSKLMGKPECIANVIAHYRKHADGLPTICFCPSVEVAEEYASAFREAGYRSVAAHGDMEPDERTAALAGLETGAVQVVTACDLISEGVDVPCVACVILCRPTKSLGLHIQQIGRGLRPMEGKTWLIVLDFAGNTLRFGLPDTEYEWSLDALPRNKKERAEPQGWRCDCGAVNAARTRECDTCGEIRIIQDNRKEKPELHPAELEELDEEKAKIWREMSYSEIMERARTEQDFIDIAKSRGYRDGWIKKAMQESPYTLEIT